MTTVFGHPRDLPASFFVKAESPFRDRGTDGSNPSPSSGESGANCRACVVLGWWVVAVEAGGRTNRTEAEAGMSRVLNTEREIFIAASPETVFRFFVEPALDGALVRPPGPGPQIAA
jgi:hypothetical protein